MDSSAFMRPVSLLEIYVMFRVSLPGRFPLLSDGHHPSLFQVFTFASDFTFFKTIWQHLAKWANIEWTPGSISLRHLNILNSQPSVWLGWSFDEECNAYLKTSSVIDLSNQRKLQPSNGILDWLHCQSGGGFFICFPLGLLGLRPQLALRLLKPVQ